MIEWVLAIHAGATCFLAGLIWVIQLVHYPLMDRVLPEEFGAFARAHQVRITPIVGPAMLAEGVAAAMLVWLVPGGWPMVVVWVGLVLVGVNALSTFLVQVPLHSRLVDGFDARAHAALVWTNWVRTVAWSVRAVLAIGLVALL
ncbi:MAG: hypothetical protein RLN76_13290 [Phycisphaeraceae bacterium]